MRFVRQNIADFIERRDGVKCDKNNIFLTNGAGFILKNIKLLKVTVWNQLLKWF